MCKAGYPWPVNGYPATANEHLNPDVYIGVIVEKIKHAIIKTTVTIRHYGCYFFALIEPWPKPWPPAEIRVKEREVGRYGTAKCIN